MDSGSPVMSGAKHLRPTGRYVLIHEQSVVLSNDSSVLGDIFAVCNSQLLVCAVDKNSGLINVLPVILECSLSKTGPSRLRRRSVLQSGRCPLDWHLEGRPTGERCWSSSEDDAQRHPIVIAMSI